MSITMTEAAAKAVDEYKHSNNVDEATFLRVRIVAGGCHGFESRLEMDKNFDEEKDTKLNFHGVDLVVDKKSEMYLEGATIHFIQTLEQSGFKVDIPSAKKTCGCGHSFQV